LHKWATRQDENFLTESLALVLEHLLILAPEVGTRLVKLLTGGFIDVPAQGASSIEIGTQIEAREGRPDMEVAVRHRLVWIEVKAESEIRVGQLEGYRVLLAQKDVPATRLVLLTRYPEEFASGDARPDCAFRWFEVADWIENEVPTLEAMGEIAVFLAQQFLNFLRTRGMTLTQVSKYMPEGIHALSNLLNMLFEAAEACKISIKKSAGWDYMGLALDGRKYWFGIGFDEPDKLLFWTSCRIDREAAARLGTGEVWEESWVPGRYRWGLAAELDSEDIHFFSRNKVRQVEWLESFLRGCLAKARSIETPDQPPIPEEPEAD